MCLVYGVEEIIADDKRSEQGSASQGPRRHRTACQLSISQRLWVHGSWQETQPSQARETLSAWGINKTGGEEGGRVMALKGARRLFQRNYRRGSERWQGQYWRGKIEEDVQTDRDIECWHTRIRTCAAMSTVIGCGGVVCCWVKQKCPCGFSPSIRPIEKNNGAVLFFSIEQR